MSALLVPGLVVLCVLLGLFRQVDLYDAFVRGAEEGLRTALRMCPYLVAVMTAVALLRETGLMDALQRCLAPVLVRLGLPAGAAPVLLLRPLSGSASLAAVSDVMRACGADSRAGRLCCVVSGASETIFFTASLYLSAAGKRRSRYALPASLLGYAAGVLAAGLLV